MKTYIFVIHVLLSSLFFQGCGSNGDMSVTPSSHSPVDPDPLPDSNNTQPQITLLGEAVITLKIGQDYTEEGAKASDIEDGDLSGSIAVIGIVNTNSVADYLLRYQVTDSNGAQDETSRMVRVYSSEPIKQTPRQAAQTVAELAYFEHLPKDYSSGVNYSAPLIIFNHGSGATGTGNLFDVECCGLPAAVKYDSWDTELPFVILSPQRVDGLDISALDDFIEYALENYQVDPQRVYLAGWSQGANISLQYVVTYPQKVAAVVPIAGGWFQGVPANVCDAADVPMWSFVGSLDNSFITDTGITAANAINNCNPSFRAKLSNYVGGTHFSTSLWPFIPSEIHPTIATGDSVEPNLFEWLQSHYK